MSKTTHPVEIFIFAFIAALECIACLINATIDLANGKSIFSKQIEMELAKPATPAKQAKVTKHAPTAKPATVAELKKQAKQAGLTNYSKLTKPALIALLAKHA